MPSKPISELQSKVGETVMTVDGLRVEAGKVAEFAKAIGDKNPLFRDKDIAEAEGYDAIPAPLTFTRIAYFDRYRPEGVDEGLGFNLGFDQEQVLHGEQAYEYERPVVVGDVLDGETTLVDVYQREGSRGGEMTFAVYETEFWDENDDLVLTERVTRIEMGKADEETDADSDEVDEE